MEEVTLEHVSSSSFPGIQFSAVGRDSSFGIATRYGLDSPVIESRGGGGFRTHADRPWGPPCLVYSGYRLSTGVKRPERGVEHTTASR